MNSEDFEGLPYQVIDHVIISGLTLVLHFRSGNKMAATAPSQEAFDNIKEDMIRNLGKERVIEIAAHK